MIRRLDAIIDATSMYRLMLYGLGVLACIAGVLAAFGKLPFTLVQLIGSVVTLFMVAKLVNRTCGRVVRAQLSGESAAITALILLFLLQPATTAQEYAVLAAAAAIAMVSKYVLVWRGQHVFNPAALAAFVVGIAWPMSMPPWWIGSAVLLAPTIMLGILIMRKLGRLHMVGTFLVVGVLAMCAVTLRGEAFSSAVIEAVRLTLLSTPLVFFAVVMLTEPLTTPPTTAHRIAYAGLVGVLFAVPFSFGPVFSTPELALLLGNLAAALLRRHGRARLRFRSSREVAKGIREFAFDGWHPHIRPGQYMEWTLGHAKPDLRGTRRTLTIVSSPSEEGLAVAVKIPAGRTSSFKRALLALRPGDPIAAAQAAGDFTLPRDAAIPLLFIAGGIGVTPFRSMLRALTDWKEHRDIVLVYACADPVEFAYRDVFSAAEGAGVRTVYLDTTAEGRMTREYLERHVPDFLARIAYVSGPSAMVRGTAKSLRDAGVPRRRIVTDVFSGY